MNSSKITAAILTAISVHLISVHANDAKKVLYEPAVVTLTGTIIQEDYGEDTQFVGRHERIWILRLDEPISVPAKAGDEIDTEETNVTEIALMVDHAKKPIPKDAFGKTRFTATGSLFHAHTTHHLRPIVMHVFDLKRADRRAK